MKKSFLILASCFCALVSVAQDINKFRFGVHLSPGLSWMPASHRDIEGSGVQMNFGVGMMGEYNLTDNYAVIFGLNYVFNNGGGIKYNKAGQYLEQRTSFSDGLNSYLTAQNNILPAGTTINYSQDVLQLPIGLKMRTNEIGSTFIRGFAQLPVLTLEVPTSNKIDLNNGSQSFNGEAAYGEVLPIAVKIGGAIGAEYYPNDTKLAIIAGLHFNAGLIDITKNYGTNGGYRSVVSDITLRLGVLF
jgi:hypothetical protein